MMKDKELNENLENLDKILDKKTVELNRKFETLKNINKENKI